MEKNKLRRIIEQRFGKVIISNGANGIEFITTCPVCGRQKLTINANTGIYKCWGCNWSITSYRNNITNY
jgi:ribosomal protein L37AE/L43A